MAFNAKTDWKYDEIVTEKDMNRVEKGIKDAHDAVASTDGKIGNLDGLNTTAKSNVVVAVNELFTNVSNGKNKIATALTDKGVPATGSETFDQLAAKISKAGIGDTDKKALIDIANRATDNDSTVRKAIITKLKAVSTENPLDLTDQSTWADISAVIPNIKAGKRFASGTATATADSQELYITVSGLTFKPSVILCSHIHGSSYLPDIIFSGYFKGVWFFPEKDVYSYFIYNRVEEPSRHCSISNDGFSQLVLARSTSVTIPSYKIDWIAYE
ncbi:hypothetical protein NW801_13855 [Brevibacillus laterosporus]|uniref:Tail fiber protein n=1 Tax=Brevibacillus halotolerans TaxID=1507437 RepID=A0ABT4HZW0_9BACL|nr:MULTISPECIES: hypothetical protein [Brevibacillus]MCR8986109.1 hypothetical protein [Brevibacillus laterosporus]MCZ0831842.1 hypothetical protein [Brevibacillus halotolerans]